MRGPRRMRPRTLLGVGVLLMLLWVAADLTFVLAGSEADHATQADAIIVLGCAVYGENGPSDCIRNRAGHAAALYNQGFAPWVIAAGGPTEAGPTEASVLARVLGEGGVPQSAIVQEDRSQNTIQNIHNSREIMRERGWRTAILVTEPFHINRAALIARDAGLEVYTSPAADTRRWREPSLRAWNVSRDTTSLMLYQVKSLFGVRE